MIATVALFLSRSQILGEKRKSKEALAKEAVDQFFSFELAEVRFRLFDTISKACEAAQSPGKNIFFDRNFPVGEFSEEMPSRHDIVEYWQTIAAADAVEENFREQFQKDTAVLMSTFDMIFRAAEE